MDSLILDLQIVFYFQLFLSANVRHTSSAKNNNCSVLLEVKNLLIVFTVTSSDCKVKKARFYEFLFTLGWRLIGNKSLYKFPAPKHVSFRKYSSLKVRVFTVRDSKIGMLSPWTKSLRLIFSSLTISSVRRYVYAQVCLFSSEKEELL